MPVSILLFIAIELIFVSYFDLKYKLIKNYWSVINIAFGILVFIVYPEVYIFEITYFIFPLVFLGVGFVLYLIKILGAGDVKYIFSLFFLIPIEVRQLFLESLLYVTIIVGAGFIIYKIVKNFKSFYGILQTRNFRAFGAIIGGKISYAPVVLLAWIVFGWKILIL